MTEPTTIRERLRALAEHEPAGDGRASNHLSITGSPAAVRELLRDIRIDGGARLLTLDGERRPIHWERHSERSESGSWVRVEPGRPPERHTEHEESARAEFAFDSDAALDEAIARESERHPELAFRYACLRHRHLRDDVAHGGLWRSGRLLATTDEPAAGHADEGERMALLVERVEGLSPPDVTA